jgi:hypothetical protein
MAHSSHSTLVMPSDLSNESSDDWSQSLVMAGGTDVSAIRPSQVVEGGLAARQDNTPSLRSLSISVPIYERLLKKTAERLEVLASAPEQSAYATLEYREYRDEMEFLRSGLERVIARLSEWHGVHCSENVVDVCASESAPMKADAIERSFSERYFSRLDSRASVVLAGMLERRAETRGAQREGIKVSG